MSSSRTLDGSQEQSSIISQEDILESKAAQPMDTPGGGLKRPRKENGSPEPKMGGVSIKKQSADTSTSATTSRKRKKTNTEKKLEMIPTSEKISALNEWTIELTSALFIAPLPLESAKTTSVKTGALSSQILAAINNAVVPLIEQLKRDLSNLYWENKRLHRSFLKAGINCELYDKLAATSASSQPVPMKPPEELTNHPVPMEIPAGNSHPSPEPMERDPSPKLIPSRFGNMNDDRRKRIEARAARSNPLTNLTPADIPIKEIAFVNDFNRKLTPENTQIVDIFSIVGNVPIARGYDRIVADGESLWIEIPETLLFKNCFTLRQRTSTRQYYTLSGVTIHKQLEPEHGMSPRRHKLAVKIPRGEPSCRLLAGRWYTHVHQIKMRSNVKGRTEWSKLRSTRLIKTLIKTFRNNYHPRTNSPLQHARYGDSTNRNRRRQQKAYRRKEKPNEKAYLESSKKSHLQHLPKNLGDFPLPMQAPQPWANPYYYGHQQPYINNVNSQTRLSERQN